MSSLGRTDQLEAILAAALRLSGADRDDFVATVCKGDPELLDLVQTAVLQRAQTATPRDRAPLDAAPDPELGEPGPEDPEPDQPDQPDLRDRTPAPDHDATLTRHTASDLEVRETGPYSILKEIGRGGMGRIYLAEDARLRRRVALKFLPPDRDRSDEAQERFEREARAASSLDHPNICAIHDVGVDAAGRRYLVMPYYDGETLGRRLRSGPLPLDEALRIAGDIASGLGRAHDAGITHRDIKPSNIMLTQHGETKILDFGIAQSEVDPRLTRTGASTGTPAYMSPEQARGETVDGRSDIWSLGAVLYEMLAGKAPFVGRTTHTIIDQVLHQDPAPLRRLRPEIPATVEDIVRRALSKAPADRFTSMSELQEALRRVARSPDAEPKRSSRVAVFAAAVAGALLLAAGLVSWQLLRKPEMLYVAATQPRTGSEVSAGAAAPSNLLLGAVAAATQSTLASLGGVVLIGADSLPAGTDTPNAVAKALAVDSVITTQVSCHSGSCQVQMVRLDGLEGRIVWSKSFEVPRDDYSLVATAVGNHLAAGFPGHRRRAGAAPSRVSGESYARYLELRHRFRSTRSSGDAEMLGELAALREAAPGFLEAKLLEATVARQAFVLSREADQLAHARRLISEVTDTAPDHALAAAERFEIERAAGEWDAAAAALAELERIEPGSTEVTVRRSKLASHRGKHEEALELMRRAAQQRPSYSVLYNLALLEYRQGRAEEALVTLARIDELVPNSHSVLALEGVIELTNGSLERAVEVYQQLSVASPGVVELTNLGLAHLLSGDYDEAAEAFGIAIDLQPGNPIVLLNAADALQLTGALEEAQSVYLRALEAVGEVSGDSDWQTLSMQAQALAHLGRGREAAAAIQMALQSDGASPELSYGAALVYAILGSEVPALLNAERALDQGMGPRWFQLPWFSQLREQPDFAARLGLP